MSAEEIRRLVNLRNRVMPEHWQAVVLWPEHWEQVRNALLAYADMVERCEKLRFNMIPHKHDTEIVDYILRGDAGKEKQ